MHIVIRTAAAAAIALTGGLSLGLAAPTTAHAAPHAATSVAHRAPAASADPNARVALPAPVRLTGPDDGTDQLTVQVSQRATCVGTTKCVAFRGTGVPDQTVVVTYQVTKDPLYSNRGAAGFATVSKRVHVDGTGDWSLTTDFSNPVITKDAAGHRELDYHVVQSKDVTTLQATARFAGSIPLR
ncbi:MULTISPECIES: hypothetical protein [Clavibacter]|uniref:Uncharacterized protein n=2 Tax=Clavibacter TaxID=1573 RepID=A0A0M3RRK1_9MICO|nr:MULTISPECIES: hypothetical protein [Clavibacter]ALD13455.1 hypothetical protein AES38_11455 [Clavibacter capsici]MBT1636542.1 hypothetical protein [Clavibacter michiganensis]OQJ63068.1 hypothetical protein B5P24_08720 [Clavibacter michiganensis subsp. tessellarius]QIS39798.1 hypothetical protein GW572_11885 [Clavibacter capsici]QIS42710.1 hypothetical protein GW571_11475 [Clavibacter capsici]